MANKHENKHDSSVQNYQRISQELQLDKIMPPEVKRFAIFSLLAVTSLFVILIMTCLTKGVPQNYDGQPIKIRMLIPKSQSFKIQNGQSRVIEVLFYSRFDDRNDYFYKTVTQREVSWSVSPQGIVQIDPYGRIQTLSVGRCNVKVQSKSNPQASDQVDIQVVPKIESTLLGSQKRKNDFKGQPAKTNKVLQKQMLKLSKEQALNSEQVPLYIKQIIINLNQTIFSRATTNIVKNNITWQIVPYADKSNRTYVKRTDDNTGIHPRDKFMYLIGERYLPGDGFQALQIRLEEQNENKLWIINSKGEISKISLVEMNYKKKAQIMVKNTQQNVLRYGIASGASLDGQQIIQKSISDNDGLWTSMYGAGQLMRYSIIKNLKTSTIDEINMARDSALLSLKAVLMIANAPLRSKTIQSKIRHYVNKRNGGFRLSSSFLKEYRTFSVYNYVGSAVDGDGLYGIDSGQIVDGAYQGGSYKYSFEPIVEQDWTDDVQDAATTKRTLDGYIARTFLIKNVDPLPKDGLYFCHNQNGTQTVLSDADILYDYKKQQQPVLDLGDRQLPQILKEYLMINGIQYNKTDIIYKGDTSTDQVIGHLFIYKIAYDILDDNNPQEKSLKKLISDTMVRFCTGLVNNNYNLIDATGQGTKWGKLTRDFIISDTTLQDAPIKAIQLLLSFKLCYYITGDIRWQQEYELLINDPSYKYLQVVASVWRRWTYRAFNEDSEPDYGTHLNKHQFYSDIEIEQHIIYSIHFSDQEEAFLAFYLAFQLEDKQQYLKLYRQGINGWWHSISKSQNPLWYYIYQLAYPKKEIKDHYGNPILKTASWALSRHNMDTKKTQAFIQGSRQDVMIQGNGRHLKGTYDPEKIIQRRIHQNDAIYAQRPANFKINPNYDPMNIYDFKVLPADQRSIHKFNGASFANVDSRANSIQPSTTYTLPYWLGVYHKMLEII